MSLTDRQREFLEAVADCEAAHKDADEIWPTMKARCETHGVPVNHDHFGPLMRWAKRMGYVGRQPMTMNLLHLGQRVLKRSVQS